MLDTCAIPNTLYQNLRQEPGKKIIFQLLEMSLMLGTNVTDTSCQWPWISPQSLRKTFQGYSAIQLV